MFFLSHSRFFTTKHTEIDRKFTEVFSVQLFFAFSVSALCLLCVPVVKLDGFFTTNGTKIFTKFTEVFSVQLFFVFLCVYFAFSVVKLDGFSPQSTRRVTQSSRRFFRRSYSLSSVVKLHYLHILKINIRQPL
jgi:hypothetical protein